MLGRELKDAITVLKRLDAQYHDRQKDFTERKKYDKALRVRQARIGIHHSIKTLEKMVEGKIGVL